jgi:Fic family protein
LRHEDFSERSPGRLVPALDGYLTFEPNPLPPVLEYGHALVGLLSEATLALGKLDGVGRMLPNPHLLIRPFVRREAVLSSQIEGTVTRLDQLLLYEAEPDLEAGQAPDVAEVANYVRALEYGLGQLAEGMPVCLRLLRQIHQHLMEGVRGSDKRPGQFRQCAVLIGRQGQGFEDARFVPASHTALDALLRDFEQFLNQPGDLPLIVQLALAHYQFETIHPFMDGNGRLGRLLITLLLCERRALAQPLLYLSAYLERHRNAYLDHLLEVSRQGAWTEWITFFARGVQEEAGDAARRSFQLLRLWQQYRERISALRSPVPVKLVDQLFASPYLTNKKAAEVLGMSFPTAQRHIGKLESAGILREITGRSRNQVFLAAEVMALLEVPVAPAEPA